MPAIYSRQKWYPRVISIYLREKWLNGCIHRQWESIGRAAAAQTFMALWLECLPPAQPNHWLTCLHHPQILCLLMDRWTKYYSMIPWFISKISISWGWNYLFTPKFIQCRRRGGGAWKILMSAYQIRYNWHGISRGQRLSKTRLAVPPRGIHSTTATILLLYTCMSIYGSL